MTDSSTDLAQREDWVDINLETIVPHWCGSQEYHQLLNELVVEFCHDASLEVV